ncbi:hypothetical protein HHO41_15170 [Bacillus sp. DNRA2]|uniref:hypothetical protein n=1 Tax=Bacillus sp. DNRA2 TaxID=2723053 RepID=UPI00145CC44B|nr:hypothetical protein [Bacillus sp. DNRA2]NMD71639.1 hypothetical protein [Bacillus sp. DNRA2]
MLNDLEVPLTYHAIWEVCEINVKLVINPVLTFITAKGSRYWIDKSGRSQRYKFYHFDGTIKGQGLKELYDYIVFVKNSDADIIAEATATTNKWTMVIRNKQLFIITSKSNNINIVSGPIDIYCYPKLGFAPIEMMKIKYDKKFEGYLVQKYYHIGNEIIDIELIEAKND